MLLTLVAYVFMPLFEISLIGNLTGLRFTELMISANNGFQYTFFSLLPFVTIFLAIGFNCLKNRYWGILVALLIFVAFYFLVSLSQVSQVFSLVNNTESEMGEGMPIVDVGIGYYVSMALVVLSFISTLVSLLPFKFNKKLEESIDSRLGKSLESGKKHISKVGHGIHDEFHKKGSNKIHDGGNETVKPDGASMAAGDDKPIDREDESRFMPQQERNAEDKNYSDYMPH